MPKKSTPIKPQKPRKIAPKPECWPPYKHDDIDHLWAREAIRCGNAEILAQYLWQADEIDPGVRRELAEMLNPTSNHFWRLEARYRSRGKPTKLAKRWKAVFNETIVTLTKLLSGVDPLDPRCPRTLSDMLDPEPRHELRLDFKQRKRGRPPLAPPPKYWPGLVPRPIETDPAMLIARRGERTRRAKDKGRKIPIKQLLDGTSRSTYYRRQKLLPKPNKTASRLKAGSPK
jgi:hypothetical protein